MNLLFVFSFVVLIFLIRRALSRNKKRTKHPSLFISILENVLILSLTLLVIIHQKISFHDLGLAFDEPIKLFIYCVLLAPIIILFHVLGVKMFSKNIIRINKNSPTYAMVKLNTTEVKWAKGKGVLGLLFLFIISGVWEEICFRGFALFLSRNDLQTILLAIIVSTFIFMLLHLRRGRIPALFSGIYGLFFFCLYLISNSLIPVIFTHITGNLIAVLYTLPKMKKIIDKNIDFYPHQVF